MSFKMCVMLERVTLEELGQKSGCVVFAGGDKVVAKVVVHEGVIECNHTFAGEHDLLLPWPFPLLASTWPGGVQVRLRRHAWEGCAAPESGL